MKQDAHTGSLGAKQYRLLQFEALIEPFLTEISRNPLVLATRLARPFEIR
jgi:hypothetical protein